MTINEALQLSKAAKNRIKDLSALREKVSQKERYFASSEKLVEPQYDVKAVDMKIVELQKVVFELDVKVKQSNAITTVDISNINKDLIFESLK